MAVSISRRIIRRTASAPASTSAASPHSGKRPTRTASAPIARHFRTSVPRRTPLSARMVRRPFTAAAIAGMQSAGAGRQSRLRPPWGETTIASAPISAPRLAFCTASTPLMVSLPGQIPRSQRMSPQLSRGSIRM